MAKDVVIAVDAEEGAPAPDEQDTLRQATEVSHALEARGHRVTRLAVTRTMPWMAALESLPREAIVFMLVEGTGGRHFLPALFCHLLEERGLAHTGACAESLYLFTNKWSLKAHLLAHGVTTPAGIDAHGMLLSAGGRAPAAKTPFLVKSVWEHASIGMAASLVPYERAREALHERAARLGGAWFAEEYVHGREFSVALLEEASRHRVLAISEIRFVGERADKPWVLDYEAKWDETSQAFRETPTVFPDFSGADARLRPAIEETALRVVALLRLAGPVRLDLRLNEDGTLHLIDVNLNPCLSSNAGFAKAAARAALPYDEFIARIVANASATGGSARIRYG